MQRDRVHELRQVRVDDELQRHSAFLVRLELLVRETETLDLLEMPGRADGRDTGDSLCDLFSVGEVARREGRVIHLPRSDFHAVAVCRELPGRVLVDCRHELHAYRACVVRVLLAALRHGVGAAAEAGDLAEHVVQRHEQIAETEHHGREQQQPARQRSVRCLLRVYGLVHALQLRNTLIRMKPK